MKEATRKRFSDIVSPYTPNTAEEAIVHLERILSAGGACSLFGLTYWRARIDQISATRGLTPEQRRRLVRLLESLASPVVSRK